ncbi:hypothetical protein [Methylotenera sp. L2L1]|uniref:hypothetical protein n=1 Tax=Methylotenera sp. L2L1 TaxID=1502770 RepID=UPI0006901795|nr:hypothetical protein [Methylotenera sp. L2L1]
MIFNKAPILSILLLINGSVAASDEDIVLAVNQNIADNHISRSFSRQIFSMKARQWPDGSPVVVFVLPDRSAHHLIFAKEILETFPYKLRSAWDRQVYSGTGQAPREVANIDQMMTNIANTPGAIGYLPKAKIDGIKIRMVEVR